MHHHAKPFIASLEADRARHRAAPADAADLERLMNRAARSDDAAWASLVARFSPRVTAVARSHRLGAHDVEDVAQTTWLQLLTHIGRVREPAKLGAYIQAIARNASRNKLSSGAGREQPLEEELLDARQGETEPGPEQQVLAAERHGALTAALEDLPARQRTLIELLIAKPTLSYAEVASELEMPIGSIGPTRARGLERLRLNPQLAAAATDGACDASE